MDYKTELQESARVHLENVFGGRKKCGFFNSFYSEKKTEKRCLLPEFRNELGNLVFTGEELEEICPFYNKEIKSKCSYEINYPNEKERLIKILQQAIFQLKISNHSEEKKLSKNLKTFLNLR